MSTLKKLRYLRIAGFAVGAVVVAGAAVVVTASAAGLSFGTKPAATTPTAVEQSNAKSSATCSEFMKHLAVRMGKSQADINKEFQLAIADTLKDEVTANHITQAQADQLKQKLANQTICQLPSTLAPHKGKERANLGAFMNAYETAAAAALNISPDELKTDLKNGQSLSQIAAAKNVKEADFRAALIKNLQPTLDKAVTDKKLTSGQEQMILNQLKTGELPLWNKAPKHPMPAAPTTASPKTA